MLRLYGCGQEIGVTFYLRDVQVSLFYDSFLCNLCPFPELLVEAVHVSEHVHLTLVGCNHCGKFHKVSVCTPHEIGMEFFQRAELQPGFGKCVGCFFDECVCFEVQDVHG